MSRNTANNVIRPACDVEFELLVTEAAPLLELKATSLLLLRNGVYSYCIGKSTLKISFFLDSISESVSLIRLSHRMRNDWVS